jgi:hypothetical protein
MTKLKFNPNYKQWRRDYETIPVYTKKEHNEALAKVKQELTVNRVVQSFTGLYGPDDCRAMQILAIHQTPDGLLIVVR